MGMAACVNCLLVSSSVEKFKALKYTVVVDENGYGSAAVPTACLYSDPDCSQ